VGARTATGKFTLSSEERAGRELQTPDIPPVLENYVDSRKFKKIVIAAACGALLTVAPAASANCTPGAKQVFAPWGDANYYSLLPNGGFESGKAGWAVSGGAMVVTGNEPFNLSGKGVSALSVPLGGSATSPTFCIQSKTPLMRFVSRLAAGTSGTLRLDAVVNGLPMSLGSVAGSSTTWAPSRQVNMWLSNFAWLAPSGEITIQFRVTATAGSWLIDDVFLDPLKRV
jgi:hypothetical protein